jgi:hypothetical protein
MSEAADVARELREFAKAGLRDSDTRRMLRLLDRAPILRGMTPVQLAGSDSRAQYEYLGQAIIDAVDFIGHPPVASMSQGSAASVSAREAGALRALFGLTNEARSRTWRVRQEDAAALLSVSWDYFRHEIQDNLLLVVAEQILNAAYQDRQLPTFDREPGIWAFTTQNDIEQQTIDHIYSKRPERATMLEFSTATTGSILRALRDVGANIRLLAANPDRVSGWHESRMRHALNSLMEVDFAAYDKLLVRLYNVPPALRGRQIGDLIILGWYSHRDNRRLDQFDPARVEVWGHDNAVVAGWQSGMDGGILETWFSREFERLWEHRSTLDEATSAGIIRTSG